MGTLKRSWILIHLVVFFTFFIFSSNLWAQNGTVGTPYLQEFLKERRSEIPQKPREPKDVFEDIYKKIIEIGEKLKTADLDLPIGLPKFSIVEGLKIGLEYKYKTEQRDNLYLRTDRVRLRTHLNSGDIVEDFPLYVNMRAGRDLVYFRSFKDPVKAKLAIPFKMKVFPTSAAKALLMKTGDMLAFPTTTNLGLGLRAFYQKGPINIRGGGFILLRGEFQIQVIRLPKSLVRVRLIGMSSKGGGARARVKLRPFGIGIVDGILKEIVNLNLAEANLLIEKGNNLLLDYIFNLEDKKASELFEGLLSQTKSFTHFKLLNPDFKCNDIRTCLITDFDSVDQLAKEDFFLPDHKKRIKRVFKVQRDYLKTAFNISTSIAVAEASLGNIYSRNHLKIEMGPKDMRYFYYPTFTHKTRTSLVFKQLRTTRIYSMGGLFETQKLRQIKSFDAYNLSKTIQDSHMRPVEFLANLQHLARVLPAEIYKRIPWGPDWIRPLYEKGLLDLEHNFETESSNLVERVHLSHRNFKEELDWDRPIGKSEKETKDLEDDSFSLESYSQAFENKKDDWNAKDVDFYYNIFFNKNLFERLRGTNEHEFKDAYEAYLATLQKRGMNKTVGLLTKNLIYKSQVKKLLKHFEIIFSDDGFRFPKVHIIDYLKGLRKGRIVTRDQKVSLLMGFRRSRVFREVGTGIILNLLKGENLEKYLMIKINLEATNRRPLIFDLGNKGNHDMMMSLDYIMRHLNDDFYF